MDKVTVKLLDEICSLSDCIARMSDALEDGPDKPGTLLYIAGQVRHAYAAMDRVIETLQRDPEVAIVLNALMAVGDSLQLLDDD